MSSSKGAEMLVSGTVEEHQQQVQGRRYCSSKRTRMFPSRLSRMESAPISGKNRRMAPRETKPFAWINSWKMSNSRWWEDFPGARMSGTFGAVLLLIIAATFVCSIYVHHEGLKRRLFVAHGTSPTNLCGSSMRASFPICYDGHLMHQQHEESEGQRLFDMTVEIPG